MNASLMNASLFQGKVENYFPTLKFEVSGDEGNYLAVATDEEGSEIRVGFADGTCTYTYTCKDAAGSEWVGSGPNMICAVIRAHKGVQE